MESPAVDGADECSDAETASEQHSSRQLSQRLAKGCPIAWDRFYTLYAERLYRFVLTRAPQRRELASDVTHDAVVAAIATIQRYDATRGTLWAWLQGIAVNKLREAFRREARQQKLRSEVGARMAENSEDGAGQLSEPPPRLDLEKILAGLKVQHCEVLRLKYLEGCSVRTIAKRLGATEKTIESRLTRARRAFRQAHGQLNAAGGDE